MKKLFLFFLLVICLFSSCNDESQFYPDPFIFKIGTPRDSVEAFVSKMQSQKLMKVEMQNNEVIKISDVYNKESFSKWARYSLYLFFDSGERISDILIVDVCDQSNVVQIELWIENSYPNLCYAQEKDGRMKLISPRWNVRYNDVNDYSLFYRSALSLNVTHKYAFAKMGKESAIKRLNKHKQSKSFDSFGIPVYEAEDAIGEMIP